MKRILIVGTGSYVGESVREYLNGYTDEYKVDTLNAVGLKPEAEHFKCCDVVFFVAGIVHGKETKKNAHLYFEVNRDFAVRVAEAAKAAGVFQFIVMSTMAVYGMAEGTIRKDTKPKPVTNYGKSKLEADRAIWKLHGTDFRVAVLRPPMIYGKGCRGNYQRLRWLTLHTPVFPKVNNERSVLYIGNLCWFVREVIDGGRQGLFFPQNAEYVNTGEMVRMIGEAHKHRVRMLPGFKWIRSVPANVCRKAFGTLIYEKTDIIDKVSIKGSINQTEL